MGPKLIQHDNLDREPRSPVAPVGDHSWSRQQRRAFDWRGIGVIAAFLLIVLLFITLRYDRRFFEWIQYGGGGWIVYVLIGAAVLAYLKWWLLVEQPGGYRVMWLQISNRRIGAAVDAQMIAEGMLKAQQFEAQRMFAEARQLTLTQSAPMPMLESGEGFIDADIVPVGPMLVPDSDWLQWIDRTPHLLLAGRTDAGKTTFAEAILAERILNGDQIVVCDPHYQPGKWHGVEATSDVESILVLLAQIEQDMAARFTDFTAGKPTEDFQRLTILIDEVPAVVEETFRLTTSGTKRIVDDRWSRFARRLGSQARKVRISVILLSQTIFVEDLMINSAYRENFIRVGLGDKARPLLAEEKRNETKQQLYELLRGQAHPAAFEHNGEIHLLDTSRVPALASRRNGHMAQLWTPPQAPIKPVVSASVRPSATVSASLSPADLLNTPLADSGRTADGQRTRLYLKAMAAAGKTREYARDRMTALNMPFENSLWTEVRRELGLRN